MTHALFLGGSSKNSSFSFSFPDAVTGTDPQGAVKRLVGRWGHFTETFSFCPERIDINVQFECRNEVSPRKVTFNQSTAELPLQSCDSFL